MRRKLSQGLLLAVLALCLSDYNINGFATGLPGRDRRIDRNSRCMDREPDGLAESRRNIDDPDNSKLNEKSKADLGTPKRLGDDIAKKFTHSRNKAISALSQPSAPAENGPDSKARAMSKLANPANNKSVTNSNRADAKRGRSGRRKGRESLLPKSSAGSEGAPGFSKRESNREKFKPTKNEEENDESFFSLLPPPIEDTASGSDESRDDRLSEGLSSWEDFLGAGSKTTTDQRKKKSTLKSKIKSQKGLIHPSDKNITAKRNFGHISRTNAVSKTDSASTGVKDRLPSIADLFPPDFSPTLRRDRDSSIDDEDEFVDEEITMPAQSALDGVLPVSDLFYRSSQSMSEEQTNNSGDDEELPFSAEQTDRLATGNRIRVRRNQAKVAPATTPKTSSGGRKSSSNRKMIRRGMEMLVGGIPINADPPQRYVDLMFVHKDAQKADWHETITINTRDFGPMLHSQSVGLVSKLEQGLYCEYFVHYTTKWGVCPKDLRTILKSFNSGSADVVIDEEDDEDSSLLSSDDVKTGVPASKQVLDTTEGGFNVNSSTENAAQGFGRLRSYTSRSLVDPDDEESELQANLGGELVFSIGVSREELECGDSPSEVPVLERVLARGIQASTECSGFGVVFKKLILTDLDDGTTLISGEFRLSLHDIRAMSFGEMERKAHRINSSLAQAMDEGDMQLAMAAAAREETAWPEEIRNRVVEEFLFEEDYVDAPWEGKGKQSGEAKAEATDKVDDDSSVFVADEPGTLKDGGGQSSLESQGPFGSPGSVKYHKEDIFLGGGNNGVFWDFSEENAGNSPCGGALGLRLVDAVVERAKQRQPRVIAIGDVHGCIDELQELLRQCGYRPGDLIVFLGDLVSKGPDSASVVQMAREIGAIGVRGNHDFEVIRWHQAIKNGVDPPVVGSEHFHIASCLSKEDMKWMYSLPWYISSRELGALFVHAGFVSGIRLAKQNPRLMMNMRSILPDGTVTSKFFNNWPWARLWDGPQTVLFGHDADRGLQQYEHAIGLDTGCVYGGRLTACILPEKRLVSVSARREYFKYRRKHYD